MIKKVFQKIRKWTTKDFHLKKTLISCGISLFAFILVFPAGCVSSKTSNEVCADYYAKISKEHTIETGQKRLSGLIVEPKNGKTVKTRTDTDNAITELWGVFKGENASFAPVMNANKKHNIYFEDNSLSSENLSFVYTNVGDSTEPYHRDKETDKVIDYKFQSSPIALMFPSAVSGLQDKLHIYISQAQAERKLIAEHKEVTRANLKELQWKETKILIDGVERECVIDNIYLDNFDHIVEQPHNPISDKRYDYYYATDIGTIIGDFVYVIFYAYKYANQITINRQSLYVMSEYSFRNKFYLEYAKENYSPNDFSYDYARSNLKEGFAPDNNILQNTLLAAKSDVWSFLLTIIVISFFITNILIIYSYQLFKQPLSVLFIFLSSLIPYFIFKIIFVLTNNTYIFSSYSLIFNLILFVVFALTILVLNCFGRRVNTEATKQ